MVYFIITEADLGSVAIAVGGCSSSSACQVGQFEVQESEAGRLGATLGRYPKLQAIRTTR